MKGGITLTGNLGSIAYLVVLFGIFYFLLLRPQQKKNKQLKEMRASLKVGDKITTIGGLVGKIIKVTEDEITLETGADKLRMTFKKWAIATVDTPVEEIE
ncbi:MAG: preprotein translocase subunit YajC [delta proteobacterium ML8_F1]|nr:MAG: preprotein translocase subunit YajC [delta proteobacterium ML8_F1]